MNRITALALLLGVALVTSACKSIPQPPPTQRTSSYHPSAHEDEYDRAYQTEAHHRHHHGRRDEGVNDNWNSYDRADGADDDRPGARRADGYQTRQDELPGASGDEMPAARTHRHRESRGITAVPGQFDFYLLNLSWSPEFCHGHPGATECAQHRAFTLHGLWPQNDAGSYPEECSDAPGPERPSVYGDIYPDPALLQHEWQMHGTCSGLGPDQFFALARRAAQTIHIPAELTHLTQQTAVTPAQMSALFTRYNPTIPASSFAITCGNNYLTAVEVCLDKNLRPGSCSAVRSCGANQIRVAAPQ